MIARLSLVLLLTLTFSVVEAGKAQAQVGTRGGFQGAGFNNFGFGGFGFDIGRLYGVLADNVPFYAAFPPVYYSAPVPRTYGYSPFAYPPGYATPDLAFAPLAAKEITNPYVPASTVPAAKQSEAKPENNVTQSATTAVPLAIVNPYVNSDLVEVEGPVLTAAAITK